MLIIQYLLVLAYSIFTAVLGTCEATFSLKDQKIILINIENGYNKKKKFKFQFTPQA